MPGQHVAHAPGRHAGVSGRVDVDPSAVGDDGPAPLQDDDERPGGRGDARAAACPSRSAWTSAIDRAVKRANSPGCGVTTSGRFSVFEDVGLTGQRVQAVGVQDRGKLDRLDDPADELAEVVGLAQPRADRRARRRGGAAVRGPRGGFEPDQAVVVAGERVGHVRRLEAGDGRLHLGRAGDPDQPRSRAQRRAAAERRGARHPASAGDDQHGPVQALVAVGGTFREGRDRRDTFQSHWGGCPVGRVA